MTQHTQKYAHGNALTHTQSPSHALVPMTNPRRVLHRTMHARPRVKDFLVATGLGLESLFRTLEDPQKTTDAFVESCWIEADAKDEGSLIGCVMSCLC